ncbi:DUF3923 family protein [Apilactobacillus apisilvae]|uniref:DUF3923 family protein n=1 Tax=Apilactobacillus apisilvae TaxID=2923364 RepID=UPI0037C1A99D
MVNYFCYLINYIIMTRNIDGSGVPQNMHLKLITLRILAVPFLVIIIIHICWYIVLKNKR